jgi:hypothetical protein
VVFDAFQPIVLATFLVPFMCVAAVTPASA